MSEPARIASGENAAARSLSGAAGAAPEGGESPSARLRSASFANLPNQLTLLRLVLCVVFFGVLIYCSIVLKLPVDASGSLHWERLRGGLYDMHAGLRAENTYLTLLLNGAFVVFVLAGLTDIADGRIARAYQLETDLGRIADPFVDKIMIVGAFTLLMPLTVHVAGWMVVVILARELLVTTIRGFCESRGVAFPATRWGKWKMLIQSVCVATSLLYLGHPESGLFKWVFLVLLWLTLASTVGSGVLYTRHAFQLLSRSPEASGQ
jgi:CDP-diacylglycerol--glycerol-3-phosphate 3-phosphatidyltransferase